jgi:hypothetical protein
LRRAWGRKKKAQPVKTARILTKAHRKQPMRAMEEQCATEIIEAAEAQQQEKHKKRIRNPRQPGSTEFFRQILAGLFRRKRWARRSAKPPRMQQRARAAGEQKSRSSAAGFGY